ncbi:multiprotein-bridging factor 1a-like [Papaver somniferum]|uniref:multiprotein-bridging factor 1a-like n=1 Tax=Papaver somniferum TaxID=3469 RepID=UPI000E6FB11E|nr:multiprotein-bridging factor 1a-like [Papaver somniferum]
MYSPGMIYLLDGLNLFFGETYFLSFYLFLLATAGTNKAASSGTSLNTRKLDEETDVLAHERVPSELKKNIMQARLDKKMTQSQLAQLINEKPQIVQEYESGKAIPNQQIITKLERVLGVKLRGKK